MLGRMPAALLQKAKNLPTMRQQHELKHSKVIHSLLIKLNEIDYARTGVLDTHPSFKQNDKNARYTRSLKLIHPKVYSPCSSDPPLKCSARLNFYYPFKPLLLKKPYPNIECATKDQSLTDNRDARCALCNQKLGSPDSFHR